MEASEEGVTAPKIRVLVADDEEIIAKTLATILNLAGYEVCAVYSGEAAVKLLDVFKPNLVITDVTMAGLTGIEVAFAARTTLPRCKILLFTGETSVHGLLGTATGGDLPFDFIMKPIHPSDLLRLLRDVLSADKPALLVPMDLDEMNIH